VGVFSKPRPNAKLSNQEAAMLERNKSLLDEEIEESEKRLKAMARGKLGYASLMSGANNAQPKTTPSAPSLVNPRIGAPGE
jgi:hypothetical protein